MQDDNNKEIQEGEMVAELSTSPSAAGASDLITLTGLINNYLVQIDRSQQELKTHKQMLEDAFANDPTYREQNEKVKEATKVRNGTKAQILKQPTLVELATKIKDMRESLKEARENLSSYLQDYAKMTGEQSFENPNGEVLQIIYTARLVRIGEKSR